MPDKSITGRGRGVLVWDISKIPPPPCKKSDGEPAEEEQLIAASPKISLRKDTPLFPLANPIHQDQWRAEFLRIWPEQWDTGA